MKYFLDTNICVYFLNGKYPKVISYLKATSPKDIKISSIVKAELLYGAQKSQYPEKTNKKIIDFLNPFEIINFDNECTRIYASIRATLDRKGTPIGPNDLFIAAIVINHGGVLVTNNVKEFSRIPQLHIENWTQ